MKDDTDINGILIIIAALAVGIAAALVLILTT